MDSRLANLRRAGFSPTGAIDGGAYCGEWTQAFWKVWPDCPVLLIEPQPAQRETLTALAAKVAGSLAVTKALGKTCGPVSFHLGETNSGVTADAGGEGVITVDGVTLDALWAERPEFKPNLLKLDLQGYELEALAGAERCLPQFEVVLLEVSVLRIGPVPIFSEVDSYMKERGYRLYDVLPQFYRPRDGALWQMDVFYVRTDSALVASQSWD
jgi:FkbM family methyltransferase